MIVVSEYVHTQIYPCMVMWLLHVFYFNYEPKVRDIIMKYTGKAQSYHMNFEVRVEELDHTHLTHV